MWRGTRRELLRVGGAATIAGLGWRAASGLVQAAGGQDQSLEVLNPQGRVPLSFFIDDSTCLVNMAHFGLPQFAEAWPVRPVYKKDWKSWPREIPDAFVREFALWCAEHGVKGKYSVVPYPACVGWLDRGLPGWSRPELLASLKLVRDLLVPNWDIHPEMISHTRVIDLATGRPLPEISSATMENSYPQTPKSADELAAYIAYALRILKNCDLPCEGVTTPGGFGSQVKSEFALAVREAVRDVFRAEVPHYFKYVVASGKETTQPRLEHLADEDTAHPRFVVSVPAATGDWFGGWTGDVPCEGQRYANADATSGRLVELIQRGEPAVMLCHWPGLYNNGTRQGFEQLKSVILALDGRFRDQTIWMKISELARYWAARQLTRVQRAAGCVTLAAPLACPHFTLRVPVATVQTPPRLIQQDRQIPLAEVRKPADLKPGTWLRQPDGVTVCFDLPKGEVVLRLGGTHAEGE